MAIRVGIVAAEPSGDVLAAGLMHGIQTLQPDVIFEGIGGAEMQALGLSSWVPMEKLSVMGLFEVIKHLPELLRIRRDLKKYWLKNPPNIFIGVDAPDFNLGLELALKKSGIKTVHYVSPTVWAWREGRIKKIKKATDLLLSIFPFETDYLRQHQVPAQYVGHALAHSFPIEVDRESARNQLGIDSLSPVLTVLPGSRTSELEMLTRPFLETAELCAQTIEGLKILVPLVSQEAADLFMELKNQITPDLQIQTLVRQSRQALASADVVLTSSGTATFEALLSKRPMVVAYRVHWLTYIVARLSIRTRYVAMSNLLVDEELAPEFIQGRCQPRYLAPAILRFFQDKEVVSVIQQRYCEIHKELRIDTNKIASQAVMNLLEQST